MVRRVRLIRMCGAAALLVAFLLPVPAMAQNCGFIDDQLGHLGVALLTKLRDYRNAVDELEQLTLERNARENLFQGAVQSVANSDIGTDFSGISPDDINGSIHALGEMRSSQNEVADAAEKIEDLLDSIAVQLSGIHLLIEVNEVMCAEATAEAGSGTPAPDSATETAEADDPDAPAGDGSPADGPTGLSCDDALAATVGRPIRLADESDFAFETRNCDGLTGDQVGGSFNVCSCRGEGCPAEGFRSCSVAPGAAVRERVLSGLRSYTEACSRAGNPNDTVCKVMFTIEPRE